jgi:alpha-beta hydrolase superfamily lysophospholipase
MTVTDQQVPVLTWEEPEGVAVRGTLVVVPGRGEQPEHYERFGRRISADGYRVHAVTDPAADAGLALARITGLLADPATPGPRVLVGSDTGALFAAGLAASGQAPGLGALVLAGFPVAYGPDSAAESSSWDAELDTRTACSTHRARLSGPGLRRGALYEPIPAGWTERADLAAVRVPVLGVHGAEDQVSPLSAVRARYATASNAELVTITGGRHDALNDLTHRTVAATIVIFLERLKLGSDLAPIAVTERPEPDWAMVLP